MDTSRRVTEVNLKGQNLKAKKNRENAEGNIHSVSILSQPLCPTLCLCDVIQFSQYPFVTVFILLVGKLKFKELN